jgi:hypothetical protein
MFHVWQAMDGQWFVDALTSAPEEAHRLAVWTDGVATRAEAEAKAESLRTECRRITTRERSQ